MLRVAKKKQARMQVSSFAQQKKYFRFNSNMQFSALTISLAAEK